MPQKALVFISHITEEKELAVAFKSLIEEAFLGMIEVFVSSSPSGIEMGRRWLEKITSALKSCAVEIILTSPESVKRPWINFEAGAGWIRDIPVIPLCHSGMTPNMLPPPLSQLQAALASDETKLELVFPVLANAIGCAVPEVDFSGFVARVKSFEKESIQIQREVLKSQTMTDGLVDFVRDTFVQIAELADVPGGIVYIHHLRQWQENSQYRWLAVNLALTMLFRKQFIVIEEHQENFETYFILKITDEGWAWIMDNREILNLIQEIPPPKPLAEPFPDVADDEVPF
jgi:hypothetical protein